MNVSAIVINYNAGHHLVECVRSLRAEGVKDIVVADNDSTDDSRRALARDDREARFVPTGGNFGYGGGANRGADCVSGSADALLVMNPDTIVQPGAIKAMAEVLEADPAVGIVGPRLENPDGSLYPSARTFPSITESLGHGFLGVIAPTNPWTRRYKMLDVAPEQARFVDWISGACFLIRRKTWDDLNGFDDDSYFMFLEDVDLCWRAGRLGWGVVYEPAARVTHVVGVSRAHHPYRMALAHHRSLLRFAVRTTSGVRKLLLPAVAAGLAVRLVLEWAQVARGRGRVLLPTK